MLLVMSKTDQRLSYLRLPNVSAPALSPYIHLESQYVMVYYHYFLVSISYSACIQH